MVFSCGLLRLRTTSTFLRKRLSKATVLPLPDFDKVFEVNCNASHLGIGAALSQGGRPTAYCREKLNGARQRYSAHYIEIYAIIRTL